MDKLVTSPAVLLRVRIVKSLAILYPAIVAGYAVLSSKNGHFFLSIVLQGRTQKFSNEGRGF